MQINILTDSETIFNLIIRKTSTTERRFTIDIKAARKAYNEGNMNHVIWIRIYHYFEDSMTKSKVLPRLVDVMKTGKLKLEVEQSVNRTITRPGKPLTTPNKEKKKSPTVRTIENNS